LLDLFPTLLELAGLPARNDLDGLSLVPQLRNANAPRERPALTTHNPGNHAVRDERWRYIRYADGSEELYDVTKDPNEWTNLAADSKLAGVKTNLARWLPQHEQPHAPRSAHRVLTYDDKTGEAVWEGVPIKRDEAIPRF
jgi:arylsulfatase A-like enzyme